MHFLKALRHRSIATLKAANITVDVDGIAVAVICTQNPPRGGWQNDDALPGIYCFVKGEVISPSTRKADDRNVQVDFVLQAKGARDDVVDQLDDMQLALEVTFAASQNLDGLCYSFRPTKSEIYTNQGEVVFAARVVTYAAAAVVPRSDPSIT